MIGIVNVNKPKGVTSSRVVVAIKKILNIDRVGHLGTLDPMAQGVLPICVGKATRLFDYYLNKTKSYVAIFKFGVLTTTLDSEGEIVDNNQLIPTKDSILKALKGFKGEFMQVPPIYSAKNINGVRAYDLARKGIKFELKSKKIFIYKFNLIKQLDDSSFEFEIQCSAGTYIRSLCRDLAKKLNTVATMTSLMRTECGCFKLQDSIDYYNLSYDNILDNLIPVEEALKDMKSFEMSQLLYDRLIKGLKTKIDYADGEYLAKCQNEVIGIINIEDGLIKIKTYLKQ